MTEEISTNKRIAKNALALYIRMFATMLIGLYTSRIVLQTLGVEDYGIYNVVGGFVSMFSLISGSLQGSVSRFLTYALGTGDKRHLQTVFSTSMYVMFGLSFAIVLAAETIGLWYLYNKMVIPLERFDAAFWCFQLSVASFIVSLLSTPYVSSIVSHERMGIYAYLSIMDVAFKLLICYAVIYSPIDKLVTYAVLLFLTGVVYQVINYFYCKHKFEECTFTYVFEKHLFKKMFVFSGWNFIGGSASVIRSQGASLILNAYGGPIINAANGVANSICSIVSGFVGNFSQAYTPQITKKYAAGDYESLMTLLIYGSKYSYFLMFILALPVMYNAEFILTIWLGEVPGHAVVFTRWILVLLLADSISKPIIIAKNANGNIRNYQIVVGSVLLLMLPVSLIGLRLGLPISFVPCATALTGIAAIFARMFMLRGDFPYWSSRVYFIKVIINVVSVSLLSSLVPSISYFILPKGWLNFVVTSILSFVFTCVSVYYVGCTTHERELLIGKAKELLLKLKQHSNG